LSNAAYPISMEIAGSTAMWTRPDSGDSPVSYPAPTFSAVRGIFESILWGPAVMVIPTKIEICSPIQFHSYYTNYGGPLRSNDQIRHNNNYQLLATVLIDVCYKLHAVVIPGKDKSQLPDRALLWDERTTSPGHAHQAIFERRLRKGQCFSIPALGWKEFTPSYFGPLREETAVLAALPDIHIPSMLHEVFSCGYDSKVSFTYEQDVVIQNGCLNYKVVVNDD